MKKIQSLGDLKQFREDVSEEKQRQAQQGMIQVTVSVGSCGIAVGALDTLKAVQQQVAADRLDKVKVSQTGCVGLCKYEPILEVIAADKAKVTYGKVTPKVAQRILREHVLGGKVVEEFVVMA